MPEGGYIDQKTGNELRGWQDMRPIPTLQDLKTHHSKYPEKKKTYKGLVNTATTYKSWKVMKNKDAVMEVALYFLSPEDVFSLLQFMTDNKKVIDQAAEELFAEDEEQE